MVDHEAKKLQVELKLRRVLAPQLMNTIEKLNRHWRLLIFVSCFSLEPMPLRKVVTRSYELPLPDELLLKELAEPKYSSVMWII